MNKVTGIFDLAHTSCSLGTLLILLEELEIQRRIHAADKADLIIVDGAKYLFADALPADKALDRSSPFIKTLMSVSTAMSGVANCLGISSQSEIENARKLMQGDNRILWPERDSLLNNTHNYDSTKKVQAFHSQTGSIPRLSVRADLLAWATNYLHEKAAGRWPVTVHLKNNPAATPGQSNADLAAWDSFFRHESCRHAHFFLIGDDPTNEAWCNHPNITVVKHDAVCIDGYLALVQAAKFFMGMMSGPANMALFGEKPYLIFKNPNHHTQEMVTELGDKDHYSFALPHQYVLRIWDTPENLIEAFNRLPGNDSTRNN